MSDEEESVLDELYRAGLYNNPPKPPTVVPLGMSEKESEAFDAMGSMIVALLKGGDVRAARERLVEAVESVDRFTLMSPQEYTETVGLLEEIAVEMGRV